MWTRIFHYWHAIRWSYQYHGKIFLLYLWPLDDPRKTFFWLLFRWVTENVGSMTTKSQQQYKSQINSILHWPASNWLLMVETYSLPLIIPCKYHWLNGIEYSTQSTITDIILSEIFQSTNSTRPKTWNYSENKAYQRRYSYCNGWHRRRPSRWHQSNEKSYCYSIIKHI